jgi:hypothetical protein
MKTLKSHLKESLKNEKFKELFEDEKELLDVSLQLQEERKSDCFSCCPIVFALLPRHYLDFRRQFLFRFSLSSAQKDLLL